MLTSNLDEFTGPELLLFIERFVILISSLGTEQRI